MLTSIFHGGLLVSGSPSHAYLTDEFTFPVTLQSWDQILLHFLDCLKLRNAGPRISVVLTFLVMGFCCSATQVSFFSCKDTQPVAWEGH